MQMYLNKKRFTVKHLKKKTKKYHNYAVAKFTVPDWGDKVDSGIGMLYRHARQHGWRAVTTTLFDFIPQSEIYEFDDHLTLKKHGHAGKL